VLAGGAESLSHAPLVFSNRAVAWYGRLFAARGIGAKLSAFLALRPSFFHAGDRALTRLTDPITELNMGQTAELVGHLFHISRRQADEYAAESQQRLAAAQKNGYFAARLSLLSRATAPCSITTTACGPTARPIRWPSSAGVRAAMGQRHARQLVANHRRRIVGHSRFRRCGEGTQS